KESAIWRLSGIASAMLGLQPAGNFLGQPQWLLQRQGMARGGVHHHLRRFVQVRNRRRGPGGDQRIPGAQAMEYGLRRPTERDAVVEDAKHRQGMQALRRVKVIPDQVSGQLPRLVAALGYQQTEALEGLLRGFAIVVVERL